MLCRGVAAALLLLAAATAARAAMQCPDGQRCAEMCCGGDASWSCCAADVGGGGVIINPSQFNWLHTSVGWLIAGLIISIIVSVVLSVLCCLFCNGCWLNGRRIGGGGHLPMGTVVISSYPPTYYDEVGTASSTSSNNRVRFGETPLKSALKKKHVEYSYA